jgi:bifunctional non-homologous end joining protein LigD
MPAKRKPGPSGKVFTVDFPKPLPAERDGEHWWMEVDERRLRLSNLDKVFWSEEGYTKGDLIAYYYNAAEYILPYLAERPLTMKRMPDGAGGKFFYEKSAPSHTPDWIPRCPTPTGDNAKGVIDYLMVENTAGLLFVANLGCVEFHPLHARCAQPGFPDYFFFDLDPFEPYTYGDVLAVARHVKAALESFGLTGYPKTSGATGMQIYVPVEQRWTYEQVRAFVGSVGRAIRDADPDRVTMKPRVADRDGHIYIDHNMNREGANIAATYSLRPEPGATVSTPVTWEEVAKGVTPQDFRIDNVFERLARIGDLFRPVLDEPQDPSEAFTAVGVEFESSEAVSKSDEIIAKSKDPQLHEYIGKRDFEGTPEPAPGATADAEGNSFVIHKHRATRLHYDLRLEKDGALPSWAIPRGLPLVQGDKRLAVRTEDHPLEYGKFEGTIPKGHYGAGRVWIFDHGTYESLEWEEKKVSFRLHGERYRGLEWHLIKTSQDWLVFLASAQEVSLWEPPPSLVPMLAETAEEPFDDPKWRFEPKLDGIRALATITTDATKLISRNGRDLTSAYPELHALHDQVLSGDSILDGEIVAVDEDGKNSFEALQQRMNLLGPKEIARVAKQIPVAYVAFDILFYDGEDLTKLPLQDRRLLLEHVVEENDYISLSVYVDGDGIAFTEQAEKLGLEGVMAKRLGSRYRPGKRSDDWRKIKLRNTQDCVILGYTPGQGGRASSFGALLVGAFTKENGELIWVGQVGSGFSDRTLTTVQASLDELRRDKPPIADPELSAVPGATFVEPDLVCEVEYQEITKSTGKMRAPAFKGLRQDKSPSDCILGS